MLLTMCAQPDHIEISKQAIRNRAIAFSKKWADATSEAAERQMFGLGCVRGVGLQLRDRVLATGTGWITPKAITYLGCLTTNDRVRHMRPRPSLGDCT